MARFTPMVRLEVFHDAFDVPKFVDQNVTERWNALGLRQRLIAEEYIEVMDEFDKYFAGEGDLPALAKELADLLVVVYGTAEILDIPLDDVFDAVMDSNMSKVNPETGKPERREDGKILKGEFYVAPDIAAVIEQAA